jgi:plasmid stabilization system protein ParE
VAFETPFASALRLTETRGQAVALFVSSVSTRSADLVGATPEHHFRMAKGLRQPDLIFCQVVADDVVRIERVIHAAQDYNRILQRR